MESTLATRIHAFLDLHPGECFSVFSVAAQIGEKQPSVAATLARLAKEDKLLKRRRGFYETRKSPGANRGFLVAGELHP